MLFGNIIGLFIDDTMIYLVNESGFVLEYETAEKLKNDHLAAWLEVIKIEPIDANTVEIQVKGE